MIYDRFNIVDFELNPSTNLLCCNLDGFYPKYYYRYWFLIQRPWLFDFMVGLHTNCAKFVFCPIMFFKKTIQQRTINIQFLMNHEKFRVFRRLFYINFFFFIFYLHEFISNFSPPIWQICSLAFPAAKSVFFLSEFFLHMKV